MPWILRKPETIALGEYGISPHCLSTKFVKAYVNNHHLYNHHLSPKHRALRMSSPPGYFRQQTASLEAFRNQDHPSEGISPPYHRGRGWTQARKSSWSPASEARSPPITDSKSSPLKPEKDHPLRTAIINVKLDKKGASSEPAKRFLFPCNSAPNLKKPEIDQGMPHQQSIYIPLMSPDIIKPSAIR